MKDYCSSEQCYYLGGGGCRVFPHPSGPQKCAGIGCQGWWGPEKKGKNTIRHNMPQITGMVTVKMYFNLTIKGQKHHLHVITTVNSDSNRNSLL